MQNKKKLLIGSLSVSAVVAGVALTGGTSAYYYDLETTTGNGFEACDFDLVRQQTTVTQTGWAEDDPGTGAVETQTQAQGVAASTGAGNIAVNLSNLQPGDAFDVVIDLKNVGSCAGELWTDIDYPIDDNENGITEPESAVGDTSAADVHNPNPANSPQGGELDDVMLVTFSDTHGNSLSEDTFHDMAYRYPDMLEGNFIGGDTDTITVGLRVPDDGSMDDGNEIMGDSFTFDVHFVQAQKNKIQPNTDLVP